MNSSKVLFQFSVQSKSNYKNYLRPINFIRRINPVIYRLNSNQNQTNDPYILLDKCLKNGFPKAHENTLISNELIKSFCKSYKSNLTKESKTEFLLHLCQQFGIINFEKTKN